MARIDQTLFRVIAKRRAGDSAPYPIVVGRAHCPQRAVLALLAITLWVGFADAQTVQGFMWPIFFKRSEMQVGQTNFVKALVTGRSATNLPDGNSFVVSPHIDFMFPQGGTNVVAISPACFLDQKQQVVFSTNVLTLVAGTNRMKVDGVGYFGNLSNMFLIFSNDVRTVIRQEVAASSRTNSGLLGTVAKGAARTNSDIYITSERLHLDYQKNIAVYYGSVHVENLTTDLRAEKLTIKRTPEGNLENILAETNVVIHQKLEPGFASGDRALYYMRDGQEALMLTGNPAKWNQGERDGQAGWITYYMTDRILRAEDKASVRFPLTGGMHADWLPGPRRTNAPASTMPQFMEIFAEAITSWLTTTNRPGNRVVAQTNVVVLGFPDQTLATAANAEYIEQLGTLELTGDAYWQQGQRIVRGERLFYDRTNQIFLSEGNSYLQAPVSEFARANTNASNRVQFVQTYADRFDYRNGYLMFYEKVRSTLVETNVIRGTLTADDFVRLKISNQVERITARHNVHGEQFSPPTRSGQMKSNKVDSEFLTVELNTNGWLRRIDAETNVLTQQFRVRSNKVTHSSLAAESVSADFFTHTNDVREVVAKRNVVITSDDSTARGQLATYTASNNLVELTGEPTLETPQFKIDRTDALFYDRVTQKFSARNPDGQARAPTNTLNRTRLPGGK